MTSKVKRISPTPPQSQPAASSGVPRLDDVLYPVIEPYREDWLDVGGSHRIRFEESGNPHGLPVVFLHGGPGSGCNPNQRRFFDPGAYRIVLFDQRGTGRSTPRGETRANTTPHLVRDMERLRAALGIGQWTLFGGSWGATLALAYAKAHRERVRGMILRGVFMGTWREIAWFLHGLRGFVPDAWERFAEETGAKTARGILDGYGRLLLSRKARDRLSAAAAWGDYEAMLVGLKEREPPAPPPPPDDALVDRVRIQLHYLESNCFLAPGELLGAAPRLAGVPGVIVQGRHDLICPPVAAHALHRAWPGSELVLVEGAGHSAFDPAIAAALVSATDAFRET
jgi:proline iminopeptidase